MISVGSITIPDHMEALLPFFRLKRFTGAGISGGRTSALMHVLTLVWLHWELRHPVVAS